MGYTTEFEGSFKLDRQLDPDTAKALFDLADDIGDLKGAPSAYCQWQPTKTLDGIEWDRNEKFYNYVEWLQFIVDNHLKPKGYVLTGSVRYQGEEIGDCGSVSVVDGKVTQAEAVFDSSPLDALKEIVRRGEDGAWDILDAVEFAKLAIKKAEGK